VLQGPISVGFGSLWPNYDLLIKSWKEILMLIAGIIVLFILYKERRFKVLHDPIIIAIGLYAILHLILIIFINNNFKSILAGLAIDLRYVLFFSLVYIAAKLYPKYQKTFVKVGIVGALIVLVFALLQVFILPIDILKYIGYSTKTISPYLTVDQNDNFIRINSTLRGPNPLGAYAGIVLTLIVAAFAKYKVKKDKLTLTVVAILSIGGLVALWASYSRSALVGTVLAIFIVLAVAIVPRLSRKSLLVSGVVLIIGLSVGSLLIVNNLQFASNVLLHENPSGDSSINSNEGHIVSLKTGFDQFTHQPFGSGVGSTGSASLYGKKPMIIENQYLFTAHEIGWLGLAIFIFIFGMIIVRLWNLRKNWLALGVLASGVGMAAIGLLLPVWVDDTISIIWWGIAAIALQSIQD